MNEIRIGRMYWADHSDRCVPDPYIVIKETKSTITLDLTDEQLAELKSDAEYYATQGFAMDPELANWIVPKAQAVLRQIEKQTP